MAEITMKLAEFQELQTQIQTANARAGDLQRQLHELTLAGAGANNGLIKELWGALGASKALISFLVANLPPESVKSWPADELAFFANVIARVPGLDQTTLEWALDLGVRANEIRNYYAHERPRLLATAAPTIDTSDVAGPIQYVKSTE